MPRGITEHAHYIEKADNVWTLSERLACLSVMGASYRAPLKPLEHHITMVLRGFRMGGGFKLNPLYAERRQSWFALEIRAYVGIKISSRTVMMMIAPTLLHAREGRESMEEFEGSRRGMPTTWEWYNPVSNILHHV